MAALVLKEFPEGTKLSDPQGGAVFWVEFPSGIDTTELFFRVVEHNVSIAPGSIFTASHKFHRYARISFGLPWTNEIEQAVCTIGQISKRLLAEKKLPSAGAK